VAIPVSRTFPSALAAQALRANFVLVAKIVERSSVYVARYALIVTTRFALGVFGRPWITWLRFGYRKLRRRAMNSASTVFVTAPTWGALLLRSSLLLEFIQITAHSVMARMQPGTAGIGTWPNQFGSYLLTQVIPFAAPILIGVIGNRELRFRVFPQAYPIRPRVDRRLRATICLSMNHGRNDDTPFPAQ
jgi:hypothetical protein